ncbi:DUF1707 SHOCT-like domain-containing protein [Mycolicibacterium mageritense]|uniref:DUF1707 SHOCT-like domain-containing protein n=1 Tax=Mycolicibacterium mageritense TaxID=53462 RepID=UPI0011D9B328|nr:DUF1707 domain-containing protein [Mycolicibacterium mageritense]TXI61486.1 MAG: DUF1707 domain-containing protein [Mycolicibacterium mageritense]
MRQAADVRAADTDRERLVAALQRHTAVGRLTIDEFSQRAAAVYRSRTMGELAALAADLPPEANAPGIASVPAPGWTALVLIVTAVTLVGLAAGGMPGRCSAAWFVGDKQARAPPPDHPDHLLCRYVDNMW